MCFKLRAIALPMFMILTGFSPLSSFAGGSDGGGGGAFVCRNADKSVKNAELLDLFEAREMGAQKIRYNEEQSVEEQVSQAIDFLSGIEASLGAKTRRAWEYIKTNTSGGGPGLVILPPSDAFNKIAKEGCPLEGMMYYDDARKKLVIKRDIFEGQHSKTEQAASMVHESLYKALRDYYGATDSRLARQITGCLFTEQPQTCLNLKKVSFPSGAKVIHCKSKEVELSLYKDGKNSHGLYSYKIIFSKVAGGKYGYEVYAHGSSEKNITSVTKNNWADPEVRFYYDSPTLTGLENLDIGLNWETPDASDEPLLEYDGMEGSRLVTKINVAPNFCKLLK